MDFPGDILIIINLILIESLLSIDNAAVLATMVMKLPKDQRPKALKYGLLVAYIFRGLALLFASLLVKIWWLKVLGGIYLLYLCFDYFLSKQSPEKEDDTLNTIPGFFERYIILPLRSVLVTPVTKLFNRGVKKLGLFWYTVVLIEMMDLAFSVDNVFAAVAFTDNIYLICAGVFIGILAMRFVAQYFVGLMEKFPFLQTTAFIVIGVLGLKLFSSIFCKVFPEMESVCGWLESETSEWVLSLTCLLIFLLPIGTSLVFGYPARSKNSESK